MMKIVITSIFSSILIFGCAKSGTKQDRLEIRSNYLEFRSALLNHDNDRASNFVSSGTLRFNPHAPSEIFNDITNEEYDLSDQSLITFENKTKAWLFPRRQAPTVGCAFVRETNGWKIDVDVYPVMK